MLSQTACGGRPGDGVREVDLDGRKVVKCLASKRGPIVLTAKVSVNWECLSWESDFSGYKMPGMQNARRRWFDELNMDFASSAARTMVFSSVGGSA